MSKRADSGGGNRRPCGGICHLCRAGQPDVSFEEINTRNPGWKQTVLEQTTFAGEIPFELVPHPPNELPFFSIRSISCLALRCRREFPRIGFGTSIGAGKWWERRSAFQELSEKYLTWCSNNGRTAHIQKLTNEHIGWHSTTCYPPASWHKGDLTALLMLFVQSRFETEGWDGMLHDVGEADVAINLYITTMFDRIGCLA